MDYLIKHRGVVEKVDGSHVQVKIVQTSACASCSVRSHCLPTDSKEKIIDVVGEQPDCYRPGEPVWVVGRVSMKRRAIVLAFVLPLALLLAALFAGMRVWGDELAAVLCAFACVAAYFVVLWFCRERLKRELSFFIQPMR